MFIFLEKGRESKKKSLQIITTNEHKILPITFKHIHIVVECFHCATVRLLAQHWQQGKCYHFIERKPSKNNEYEKRKTKENTTAATKVDSFMFSRNHEFRFSTSVREPRENGNETLIQNTK